MEPWVGSLRRYAVKSMGGEDLAGVEVDARGLVGDRWFAVEDEEGRFAAAKSTRRFRRRDAVLDYAASTGPGGRVSVAGAGGAWSVGDPALDQHLSRAVGVPVRVTAESDVAHQDAGSVSLVSTATLRWCAEQWGGSADARRLRANVVVEAVEPFAEEQWVGRDVAVGSVVLRVAERAPRCRVIDLAQDGVDPGSPWLGPSAAGRDRCLAVYADVVEPGHVHVGDVLRVG